ncbi:fused MFS/spermidine synthase [Saxibacter everestensis]|uniref:Fused MFS/spermidine synthase n=1 Tax=Saxibacter everestensis TaxID=2909229 RepID=A0ABY8QWD2_9MICO|nr:fused MFS/spermidine synthase [Brevibacteriaceae bacterium ZFBP1038]
MPRPITPTPVPGEYPISTGTAKLVADAGEAGSWTLWVNGVPSSHIVIGAPERLEFEYMDWIAKILEQVSPAPDAVRALHLGAAGCALPRYIEATRPGSRQLAVEIDARLAELVRDWFDVPRAPLVKIRVGDAGQVVRDLPENRYEIIIRDAFSAETTPVHLADTAFFEQVLRVAGPNGIYLANVADKPPLKAAKAEIRRLFEVFEHVIVAAEPAQLKGRRYGNLVAMASALPLPATEIGRALRNGAAPARVLSGTELQRFCAVPA